MGKRQCQLTEAEQQTRNAYELRRLQAVRLYGSGVPTREIRQVVNCSDRRIRQWSQKYGRQGLDALKLSREQRAELKERLHQYRPDQVIAAHLRVSRGQFWTISNQQMMVKTWYGVSYT